MRTNIEIDDALMAEAQRVSGQPTKKQTVEQALRLMINCASKRTSARHLVNTAGAAISARAAKDEGPGDRCRQQRLD